jgi:predicted TIM-barrel fold metal-dependent hydrolase
LEALFSADSHVVEPPDLFVAEGRAAHVEAMPRVVDAGECDRWVFPGTDLTVGLGLVGCAGAPESDVRPDGRVADVDPAAFDVVARLVAQDRDGVVAEVVYPTVGLIALTHPDLEARRECCDIYNRWIAEWCARCPDRMIGVGMSSAATPEQVLRDARDIAARNLRGMLLPAAPPQGIEYEEAEFDTVWRATAELGLVVAFHVHTVPLVAPRGSPLGVYTAMIRSCQDALGALVFGGVLERVPELRVVLVESDAGWLPHFAQRMDRAWSAHGQTLGGASLGGLPSDAIRRSVFVTFQDDPVALGSLQFFEEGRLLWGSDFPHVDSTWPRSRELLQTRMAHLDPATRRRVVHDNVASLFSPAC